MDPGKSGSGESLDQRAVTVALSGDTWGLSEAARSLAGGVAGSVALVVSEQLLTMPTPGLLYSTLLALGSYTGTVMILPRRRSLRERLRDDNGLSNVQSQRLARFVQHNRARQQRLSDMARNMGQPYQELLEQAVEWIDRIIGSVMEDPSDLSGMAKFEVHLQASTKVVEKVHALQARRQGARPDAMQDIEAKFEQVLRAMISGFEKQFEQNLEDDFLELDVDLDVLEQSIRRSGLQMTR